MSVLASSGHDNTGCARADSAPTVPIPVAPTLSPWHSAGRRGVAVLATAAVTSLHTWACRVRWEQRARARGRGGVLRQEPKRCEVGGFAPRGRLLLPCHG